MIPKKHEKHMSNDARIAVLETTMTNINSSLIEIKQEMKEFKYGMQRSFEKIDNKFDALETKMDSKFDSLQNRMWSNFLWLMGMIIGLAGLIAHTQHWI